MRLKYDLDAGALYIRLTDEPVTRTRDVDDNTSVDLDQAGQVIGIEVISIAHPWPLDAILRDFPIPAGEAAQLRAYFKSPMPATMGEAPMLNIEQIGPVIVAA